MRSVRVLAFAAVLAVALAACGKGDRKKCEQACRNYATLQFWAKWDPLIDAEPEAERVKLRREKIVELENMLKQGVDQCVTNCQTANNPDDYECAIKAKTAAEANACMETEAKAND